MRRGRLRLAVKLALALGTVWAAVGRPAGAAVTAEQLRRAMDGLVVDIRRAQRDDGSFRVTERDWLTGQTALAVLALRAAGVGPDDPAIRKAGTFLADRELKGFHAVYETALKVMALAQIDEQAYRPQIKAGALYLIRAQQGSGGWSYTDSGRTDNSNSQFAILGLHAAALAGVGIPEEVWEKARVYFVARQGADGGWGYTGPGDARGSMTVAGVASLYVCDLWLHVRRGKCGIYPDQRALQSGLQWLARNFSVTRNPGFREWKYYYLYGLERAGSILARRYFGNRDWYREGVEHLVDRGGARVAGMSAEWPLLRKCFALLFLAKGNAPLVIQKAEWPGGRWDKSRYDLRFLTTFMSDRLGQQLDWQIVPIRAPLDRLVAAPILYVSGHGAPGWTPEEVDQMRRYVEAGGVLFAEAVDGDAAFDRGFRAAMERAFPDQEFSELPDGHPIYDAHFDLAPRERPPLEGLGGPCWLSVIYAPDGLSCPLDVADYEHWSFRLGTNVVAYVTGLRPLAGKLAKRQVFLPSDEEPLARGGAFVMGQVVHGGQWQPHKLAWPKTLERLTRQAGVEVYSRPVPVDVAVETPFVAHVLYLTGVGELRLGERARQGLLEYLDRGGFLFVEAACGSAAFDRSLRELAREMFPGAELGVLPVGHPLLEGGPSLGRVEYTDPVLRANPDLSRPFLEFIERDGRVVLVYSKYDLSSAIDGHPCHRCPAVLEPSAGRLAMKVLLYGLSN